MPSTIIVDTNVRGDTGIYSILKLSYLMKSTNIMMYKAKKKKLLYQFVEAVKEETKSIFGAIFKKFPEKKKLRKKS